VPFVAGAVPFVAGAVPFVAGAVPFVAGAVPFVAGAVPFVAGAVPFVAETQRATVLTGTPRAFAICVALMPCARMLRACALSCSRGVVIPNLRAMRCAVLGLTPSTLAICRIV